MGRPRCLFRCWDFGRRGLANERVNANETGNVLAKSLDRDGIGDAIALAIAAELADADQASSSVSFAALTSEDRSKNSLIIAPSMRWRP
jgi:hypothetical protein